MLYELYKGLHYCVSNCVWHLCDYLLCVCNSEIHKMVQTIRKTVKATMWYRNKGWSPNPLFPVLLKPMESRIIGKEKKNKIKGIMLWLLVLQNEINFQSHIKQRFKENVSQTILEESQPSPTRQLLKQIFWFNVLLKQYLTT